MRQEDLLHKIQSHEAGIGVIGLGYVGLPSVLRFGEEGFNVIGFDIDPAKVSQLNAGQSYIRHIEAGRIHHLRSENRFEATSDFSGSRNPIASLFVFQRR